MKTPIATCPMPVEESAREFYLRAMSILDQAGLPYLVGGGYAMACHAGIIRQTKDLDLFMRLQDRDRALETLAAAGFRTERIWPHFLVKVLSGQAFIDILHNSGNGLCPVDDLWFEYATEGAILGRTIPLCAAEEMIWSKAFVQERDRYDGADIAHILLARGPELDWQRLFLRFRGHERILLAHLLLFGYVFPADRDRVPHWAIDELYRRAHAELPAEEPLCRGTFLSQSQYLQDIRERGYRDARLRPHGPLTAAEIAETMPPG